MNTTERGFRIYADLADSYRSQVRVVESSSSEEPKVWIFSEYAGIARPPHLTVEQAATVCAALAQFCADNKTLCQAEGTNRDE